MKAIVNTAPGQLTWMDCPTPEPGPGQVRIRTASCGVCATDILMIAGWQRTVFPSIPGHEWSGVVEAAGPGVDPAMVGAPCVAENVLTDGGEVGFEHPGGYGECLLTDAANVHPLPSSYPLSRAALIEPLAVVVRGLTRLHLLPSPAEPRSTASAGPILVIGDGTIGLLTVMLLRYLDAGDVYLVGGRSGRLSLAAALGAKAVLNYHQNKFSAKWLCAESGWPSFNIAVEASGSASAMSTAIEAAGHAARILVLGDYGSARSAFAWNHLLHNELELIGSNASAGAWPTAVSLAVSAGLPLDRLVTHRLPASQFQQAYDLTRSRSEDVVKVIMEWQVS